MKITQTQIEMHHLLGQFDEVDDILKGVNCPQRRLNLRCKKAELTDEFRRLQQDRQREVRNVNV